MLRLTAAAANGVKPAGTGQLILAGLLTLFKLGPQALTDTIRCRPGVHILTHLTSNRVRVRNPVRMLTHLTSNNDHQ